MYIYAKKGINVLTFAGYGNLCLEMSGTFICAVHVPTVDVTFIVINCSGSLFCFPVDENFISITPALLRNGHTDGM